MQSPSGRKTWVDVVYGIALLGFLGLVNVVGWVIIVTLFIRFVGCVCALTGGL